MVLLVSRIFGSSLPVSCQYSIDSAKKPFAFSSAIAIRAPSCAFSSPSFHGMCIVCDISAVARDGCRAKRGLPVLIRLRRRAHHALVNASAANATAVSGISFSSSEEDDLSHFVSAARLRRIGYSPGQRLSSGVFDSGLAHQGGDMPPSPISQGSFATSITLAEPMAYDPMSGLIMDQPTFPGIVPPLPPEGTEETWYQAESGQDLLHPWLSMSNDLHDGGPGDIDDLSMPLDFGLDSEASAWGDGVGRRVDDDLGDEFDFEAFVNQVGMGEMGLVE